MEKTNVQKVVQQIIDCGDLLDGEQILLAYLRGDNSLTNDEAAKNALQVQKACDYYFDKSGGRVGAGNDPVGFLIATLEAMQRDRDNWKECASRLAHHMRIIGRKTRSKSLADYANNTLQVNDFDGLHGERDMEGGEVKC